MDDDITKQQEKDEDKELNARIARFKLIAPDECKGILAFCLGLAVDLQGEREVRDTYAQDAARYKEVRNLTQLDWEWLQGKGKFNIPSLYPQSNNAKLSKDALFDAAIDHAIKLRNGDAS